MVIGVEEQEEWDEYLLLYESGYWTDEDTWNDDHHWHDGFVWVEA